MVEAIFMRNIPISIIMLTYNRETFIKRAIKSVLAQDFSDYEFIIIDNGSTDRSGAIADEYAAIDTRIKVIHRVRGNIGSGRNSGLDVARGAYIAFIDDDDECEPDYLSFLYRLAVKHNADISICGATKDENGIVTKVGDSDNILKMDTEEAIISLMWRRLFNTGLPTKLISAMVFKDIRFSEIGKYDDISLLYKLFAQAKVVAYQGLPKYKVYRHEDNNSSATTKDGLITPDYLDAYRQAYRERTEWLCERFPHYAGYWWYFDFSFQISMVNKILSNRLKECEEHLKAMRDELAENYDYFMNSTYILDFEKAWMEEYIVCNG